MLLDPASGCGVTCRVIPHLMRYPEISELAFTWCISRWGGVVPVAVSPKKRSLVKLIEPVDKNTSGLPLQ